MVSLDLAGMATFKRRRNAQANCPVKGTVIVLKAGIAFIVNQS
jgi:hypothetical protein